MKTAPISGNLTVTGSAKVTIESTIGGIDAVGGDAAIGGSAEVTINGYSQNGVGRKRKDYLFAKLRLRRKA